MEQIKSSNDAKLSISSDIAKLSGDKIKAIGRELESMSGDPETPKDCLMQCGMFNIKSVNDMMKESSSRPDPKPLWKTLWYEGEVSCLFADSGNGKSIYAVQMATHIAKEVKVLYFDFELSDKQFQLRYTDKDGRLYQFPSNLYRVEINPETMNVDGDFEDAIVADIEKAAVQTDAKVLIIDNLTWMCVNSEKGDAAGILMIKLMKLKKKYGWSVLVLAHTPKRPLTEPITANHLAGSKKLYNFFDSAFTIGLSAKDTSLRYIKQMKVRYGDFTYDGNNVMVCQIEQENAFLHFEVLEFSSEMEHLRPPLDKDVSERNRMVKELSEQGKSLRGIAGATGISKSTVSRILKN